MKKHFIVVAVLAAILILAGQTYADQVKVNIVYPIGGASYPITDVDPGKHRYANFTASFSVTCQGEHKVEWGFKGDVSQNVGGASFIDQISIQFVHQLKRGDYLFWVRSDCGENGVKFKIGQ